MDCSPRISRVFAGKRLAPTLPKNVRNAILMALFASGKPEVRTRNKNKPPRGAGSI